MKPFKNLPQNAASGENTENTVCKNRNCESFGSECKAGTGYFL